jgi:hypothetical protein
MFGGFYREKGLWVQVISEKYISPTTVEDWVRNPDKQLHNASIIWKVVNSAFHLVGNWLIWKVGKGEKVQIGLDPWIGSKGLHRLPPWLIQDLRSKGFYILDKL